MSMQTALITGAAGGIGRELARQLAERGTKVIAVCRKQSAELSELPVRVEAGIDIATDAGCAALAARVAGIPLDLVIHNAGVLSQESLDALDDDAVAGIRRPSLAHDLAPRGVAVVMLHPGFVQTPMTGGRGDVDAVTAARNLIARIDELTPATSGNFVHANGAPLPW